MAVLGGSLAAQVGGHNPIEPLAAGLGLVVGPHTAGIDSVLSHLRASASFGTSHAKERGGLAREKGWLGCYIFFFIISCLPMDTVVSLFTKFNAAV